MHRVLSEYLASEPQTDFPGVLDYEVSGPLGAWYRCNRDADHGAVEAEARRLIERFFNPQRRTEPNCPAGSGVIAHRKPTLRHSSPPPTQPASSGLFYVHPMLINLTFISTVVAPRAICPSAPFAHGDGASVHAISKA